MSKKQSQNTAFGVGDYDQPTEPLEEIVLPQQAAPTYTVEGSYPDSLTVPSTQKIQFAYPSYQAPSSPVYPVLPPPPLKKYRGYPPGGSPPISQPARVAKRHWSPLPGLVGLFFVLVQLLLLARVLLMLFSVAATALWLNLLVLTSDWFVGPFRWLAANINLSLPIGTDLLNYLEFLLAILAYGIFSRLLVRLLKALLHSW